MGNQRTNPEEYSRNSILSECYKKLSNPKLFYKPEYFKLIKATGQTSDTGEFISEVIAEFIIEHIDVFEKGINPEQRKRYRDTTNHENLVSSKSVRSTNDLLTIREKDLAKELFNLYKENPLPPIGTIVDVETPLTARQSEDKAAEGRGDIDLLADDGRRLVILELKKTDNKESMLRCVMESYTYLKTVNHKNLIDDFVKNEKLLDSYIVTASPLVFKGGEQYKEMTEQNRPQLKKLMNLLGITPLYYRYDDAANEFVITYK